MRYHHLGELEFRAESLGQLQLLFVELLVAVQDSDFDHSLYHVLDYTLCVPLVAQLEFRERMYVSHTGYNVCMQVNHLRGSWPGDRYYPGERLLHRQ